MNFTFHPYLDKNEEERSQICRSKRIDETINYFKASGISIYIYMYSISFIATENKGESIRERTENRADERVAEIISGKHEEGRSEGRGQEAAWGVL